MERCAMWWWCLFLTIIRTIYMEPMEPYNSGSIQIGSIDIGSYQSGSQLVLLPIWLPIGVVTNLAPNWCRYQSGFQWVFVMTSWRRKLSTERHPLEVIVKKSTNLAIPIWIWIGCILPKVEHNYQFGDQFGVFFSWWRARGFIISRFVQSQFGVQIGIFSAPVHTTGSNFCFWNELKLSQCHCSILQYKF